MSKLQYAVHAYAWTTSWSNDTLNLIDRAKNLGFDLIEIPLMEIEKIDPVSIKQRLEAAGLGVCTSTACSEANDLTGEDEATRAQALEYLKACVKATAEMGANTLSGVIYSAIGRKIDSMPGEVYWERAATGLKKLAKYAQDFDVTIGVEPINRYETFLINTCEQAMRLREMIDEPNVAIHPDTYQMNIEENNFYEPTKLVAPYICHYHLSESHRGTPGQGTVNWDEVYRALGEEGYRGVVGMESFLEVSDAMRSATCVWREMAPSTEYLLTEGLKFLHGLDEKYIQ